MAFLLDDNNPIVAALSRLTGFGSQISATFVQTGRTIVTGVFLVGISVAQQTPQEPAPPAFRVQTDLVVVPFQFQRGPRSVSDLKPSDIVLLEDGLPRAFTGFEAPRDRPSLELVVMFDVTDVQRGGFWNAKALHDLASYWNETTARALLEERGATIRISVYQFDQSRLRRLSRANSNLGELLDALHRLSDPIPASPGFDLQLPAGVVIRHRAAQEAEGVRNDRPWPLSLAGAITALRDSTVGAATAARALVIFSPGAEGTSITPQDLVDQAVAANVPVYPVALPSNQSIWYEGSPPDSVLVRDNPTGGPRIATGGARPQWGICPEELKGRPPLESELFDCPLNPPFEDVGRQTGGRAFEAQRRPGFPKLPHLGEGLPLDRFSMTGGQVNDAINAIKKHALARFTSSYTVWFAPSRSVSPRKHKLEVKLDAKSNGKVTDGKRSATY